MSPIVITIPGAKHLLWGVRYTLSLCILHLFVNDWQPSETDLQANYVPASFPGYQPVRLKGWSYPYTNAGLAAQIDGTPAVFTQTGLPTPLQTVYGYFVLDPFLNLVYAQRTEDKGYLMVAAPLTYQVNPSLALSDLAGKECEM